MHLVGLYLGYDDEEAIFDEYYQQFTLWYAKQMANFTLSSGKHIIKFLFNVHN